MAASTTTRRWAGRHVEALAARDRDRLTAALHERDDRIGWMRVVCSGSRRPS